MGLTAFRLHERLAAPAAPKRQEPVSEQQRIEAHRAEVRELRRKNAQLAAENEELRRLLDEASAPTPEPAESSSVGSTETEEHEELRRALSDQRKTGKRRG